MVKRASQKPLEWKFDYINATDGTVTNGRIELGLKDDEVAEIWKVDSQIGIGNISDAANDEVAVYMMLSMDPDIAVTPANGANHEDLEVFFEHAQKMEMEVGAAGTTSLFRGPQFKVSDFNPPVLVGTDVGQVIVGDAVTVEFWTRIYFTRRKATVAELNQILLKRR